MKTFLKIFLFAVIICCEHYSQPDKIIPLPYQKNGTHYFHSHPVNLGNNEIIVIYTETYQKLRLIRSYDNGLTWEQPVTVFNDISSNLYDQKLSLSAAMMNNGVILISWTANMGKSVYSFSHDKGFTWSSPRQFLTGSNLQESYRASFGYLSQTKSNQITYVFRDTTISTQNIYLINSLPGDTNWTERKPVVLNFPTRIHEPTLMSIGSNKLICTFRAYDSLNLNNTVFYTLSSDNGENWTAPAKLLNSSEDILFHRFVVKSINEWYFIYTIISDSTKIYEHTHYNYDIVYRTSSNQGANWSNLKKFTHYEGKDTYFNTCLINNKITLSFTSERSGLIFSTQEYAYYYPSIHIGVLDESSDKPAPPFFVKKKINPLVNMQSPFSLQVYALGDSITSVKAKLITDYKEYDLTLFDDGLHHDIAANDNVYGAALGGMVNIIDKNSLEVLFRFEVNNNYFTINIEDKRHNLYPTIISEQAVFDINRLRIPFDNKGITATIENTANQTPGGYLDNSLLLFSGGFFLSGYTDQKLWVSALASASHLIDFLPGGLEPIPYSKKIFVLRSSDPPFGVSWQTWKFAVEDGAPFYDGDGDGKYNPVDKNFNGIWDPDEDRPDLIGDYTAWCIFNDGVPPKIRRYQDTEPQKIEVQQTIFGWKAPGNQLENVMFIRYKIENKNPSAINLDSVYFSMWSDPDIGDYNINYTGCDTLLNANYVYNKTTSQGVIEPVFLKVFLQGPLSYIPGITFTDVDGDGRFTAGTDIPLDTAYSYQGEVRGIQSIPGAKKLGITSFVHYMRKEGSMGDPFHSGAARGYMKGLNINPCNWSYGTVVGIPCGSVNPQFMYSGNPVTNTGWINTKPTDQRMMGNTGPFKLERNKPVEIVIAYVGGRGDSPLNSITVAKENGYAARELYNSNFNFGALNSPNIKREIISNELGNNYPNPFNPATTISYRIETPGHVTMKIFDVLGREVSTLINQVKEAGVHRVEFDGSRLASGIYFYELRVNQFREIKKMLLIR